MQLLTNVVKNPNQRAQFTDPAAMQTICERVILPNLQLRGAYWLLLWAQDSCGR